jgi:hypothetical protein
MTGITNSLFQQKFLPRLHASVPVEAADASLPALRSDDDLNGGLVSAASAARSAAVLVALIERDGELHVLLTQRSDSLPTHPGPDRVSRWQDRPR